MFPSSLCLPPRWVSNASINTPRLRRVSTTRDGRNGYMALRPHHEMSSTPHASSRSPQPCSSQLPPTHQQSRRQRYHSFHFIRSSFLPPHHFRPYPFLQLPLRIPFSLTPCFLSIREYFDHFQSAKVLISDGKCTEVHFRKSSAYSTEVKWP